MASGGNARSTATQTRVSLGLDEPRFPRAAKFKAQEKITQLFKPKSRTSRRRENVSDFGDYIKSHPQFESLIPPLATRTESLRDTEIDDILVAETPSREQIPRAQLSSSLVEDSFEADGEQLPAAPDSHHRRQAGHPVLDETLDQSNSFDDSSYLDISARQFGQSAKKKLGLSELNDRNNESREIPTYLLAQWEVQYYQK